jgi:predicted nucleic acid-binding protein
MVFLDANILLELSIANRANAEKVRSKLSSNNDYAISMLTVHLIWHFGRQAKIDDNLLDQLISTCTVVDLTEEDYLWARNYEEGYDFEDALQIACALRSGCTEIMTLDKNLAKRYQTRIKFITP